MSKSGCIARPNFKLSFPLSPLPGQDEIYMKARTFNLNQSTTLKLKHIFETHVKTGTSVIFWTPRLEFPAF
jgi:hypothetical protein